MEIQPFNTQIRLDPIRYQKYLRLSRMLQRIRQFLSIEEESKSKSNKDFITIYGLMNQSNQNFQGLLQSFNKQRLEESSMESIQRIFDLTELSEKIEQDLLNNFSEFNQFQLNPCTRKESKEWFVLPRLSIQLVLADQDQIDRKKKHSRQFVKDKIDLSLLDPRFKYPEYILGNCETNDPEIGKVPEHRLKPPLRRKLMELIGSYPFGITIPRFLRMFQKSYQTDFIYLKDYNFCATFLPLAKSLVDVFWVVENTPHKEVLLFPSYLQNMIVSPLTLFFKIWKRVQLLLDMNKRILKLEDIPEKLWTHFGISLDPSNWFSKGSVHFYEYCIKEWSSKDLMRIVNAEENSSSKFLIKIELVSYFKKSHKQTTLEDGQVVEDKNENATIKSKEEYEKSTMDFKNFKATLFKSSIPFKSTSVEPSKELKKSSFHIFQDCRNALAKKIQAGNFINANLIQTRQDFKTPLFKGLYFEFNKRHLGRDGSTLVDFMQLGDRIESMEDEIKPGIYTKCIGAFVQTPEVFYVQIKQFAESLLVLMARMMKMYDSVDGCKMVNVWDAVPTYDKVVEGLYVVIRKHSDGEWYRCQVIELLGGESCKVFFIDFGDIDIVHFQELRYMFKEYARTLKAQAIRCSLNFGPYYDQLSPNYSTQPFQLSPQWNQVNSRKFFKIIFDKDLAMYFKKRCTQDESQVWKVTIHILKDDSNLIEIHHVERQVIREIQSLYLTAPGEETQSRAEIELIYLTL